MRAHAQVVRARCRSGGTRPRARRPSSGTTRRPRAGGTKNSISICSNSRVRKRKLPGVISLRNDLPTCAMPNGGLPPRDLQDVLEVDEDALRRLGPQVDARAALLDGADRRLEHEVEVARLGQIAVRALARGLAGLLRAARVVEVVGAEAVLADAAVDHRIREAADVARGLPDARVQHERGVERDDVVALLHHRAQPGGLDVALHEHAVVRVVVGRAEAAVDLRGREDEARGGGRARRWCPSSRASWSASRSPAAAYRALAERAHWCTGRARTPARQSCVSDDLADPARAACRPRARSARRRRTCRHAPSPIARAGMNVLRGRSQESASWPCHWRGSAT